MAKLDMRPKQEKAETSFAEGTKIEGQKQLQVQKTRRAERREKSEAKLAEQLLSREDAEDRLKLKVKLQLKLKGRIRRHAWTRGDRRSQRLRRLLNQDECMIEGRLSQDVDEWKNLPRGHCLSRSCEMARDRGSKRVMIPWLLEASALLCMLGLRSLNSFILQCSRRPEKLTRRRHHVECRGLKRIVKVVV